MALRPGHWREQLHPRDGAGRFRDGLTVVTRRRGRPEVIERFPAPPVLIGNDTTSGLHNAGGSGRARLKRAADGSSWVFKPATGLGGMSHAERTAHTLARRWGFPAAELHPVTVDGREGNAQRLFPGVVDDLFSVDVRGFTAQQAAYLAAEQILDYALGNVDDHGGNFVVLSDGTIRGVDKEFAFYPQQNPESLQERVLPGAQFLAGGGEPYRRPKPYEVLLAAVIDNTFDDATVTAMRTAATAAAARIHRDSSYATLLPLMGIHNSAQDDAATYAARHGGLPDEIRALWDRLLQLRSEHR